MWSESHIPKSASSFSALFGRKKRINNAKAMDDLEGSNAALINNIQTTPNGFIDSEIDYPKDLQPASETSMQTRVTNASKYSLNKTAPSNTFFEKVRFNKGNREKHLREVETTRSESVPLRINTLPIKINESKKVKNTGILKGKSHSEDVVYLNTKDPEYLMEALETIADEQPLVARSIPKHAVIDTSHFARHSLDNCLFDASVYDSMLHDSIKTCELLQDHLNDCIACVRAQSPLQENGLDNEQLCNDKAETVSVISDENLSQQTILTSPNMNTKHVNEIRKEASAQSNSRKMFVSESGKLLRHKPVMQYQC